MNLHQFRFVQEAVRRNLNLTETAKALFTSQPGISKAILELEEELGIDLFVRHGKRLRRVTEPGQEVLKAIDVILREVANMKRIGEEYSKQDAGTLSIAATHTQARYVLPEPVAQLRRRFPKVQVSLHQGSPAQVVQMLLDGTADIGLATESLSEPEDLVSLPCYEWEHVIVMRAEDPLAEVEKITLEQLANETLISYHPSFTGRRRIDAAFAAPAQAQHRAGGDRLRRHQDLREVGTRRGHRRRDGRARRSARRRAGAPARRPPVRQQRHPRRVPPRCLPARLRAHVRRAPVRPSDPAAAAARARRVGREL